MFKRLAKASVKKRTTASCLLETLEPRILYSADPLSASLDTGASDIDSSTNSASRLEHLSVPERHTTLSTVLNQFHDQEDQTISRIDMTSEELSDEEQIWSVTSELGSAPSQLVVVNVDTPELSVLLDQVSSSIGENSEILLISDQHSGLKQISDYLDGYSERPFSAIHFISHADGQGVKLGDEWVGEEQLLLERDRVSDWQSALIDGADLLFYGCNLASDASGVSLLSTLASLTGADVAASDDLTGAKALGGDWELEYIIGDVVTQSFVTQSLSSEWLHTLGPPGAVDGLWLSLEDDGALGTAGELLEFADPNLSFEPAGMPASTTDGSYSSVVNLDVFDLDDGDVKVSGIHYVSTTVTVGQTTTFDLQVGDLLLSVTKDETLTSNNSLSVEKGDVFVFRPSAANDYSSGDFYMLLDQMPTGDKEVRALSLVEQDTIVGGTSLLAGSFIYAQQNDGSVANHEDILVYNPISVGEDSTSGSRTLLIDGASIGLDKSIRGLELVEVDSQIAGANLSEGSILINVDGDVVVGDNNLSADREDVVLLDISQATVTGASPITAMAEASLFFDGSDVDLTDTKLDGIALVVVQQNQEPIVSTSGLDPSFVEGAPAVVVFGASSVDLVEAGQSVTEIVFKITHAINGSEEILRVDGTDIALIDGLSGSTAISGFTYQVSANGAEYTLVLSGGNLDPASAETLIDTLTYRNTSQQPDTSSRVISLVSLKDSGGVSGGGDDTVLVNSQSSVAMTPVNDAPTATVTALNPVFLEGDSGVLLFADSAVSTVEIDQFVTGLTITVSNVSDGVDERLIADGISIVLVDGESGVTVVGGANYTVSVVGNLATVVFTGANTPVSDIDLFVDALRYQNLSGEPVAGDRVITLTSIVDNGGVADGGSDSGVLALASTVSVQPVNQAPEVTVIATDPTFTLGGSPVSVFSNVTIDLIETGQSVVGFVIDVAPVSDGVNEVLEVDGTSISLINASSGSTAGHGFLFDVSVSGSTRTVTFTGGSVSAADTEVIINEMTYQNNNAAATLGVRSITLVALTDDGGTDFGGEDTLSLSLSSDVNVILINSEPSLTAVPTNPTFIEGSAAVQVFDSATIDTMDAGQTVSAISLQVSGLVDGVDEKIIIDGAVVTLVDGESGVTAVNGINYSVSEVAGTATLILTSVNLSESDSETLLENIGYRNDSAAPSVGIRLVTMLSLTDSGGTASGGDDTVDVSIQSSVNVQSVNQAPTASIIGSDPSFVEGSAAVSLFNSVIINPIEAGQLIVRLSFTVTATTDGADERLIFDGTAIELTHGNSGVTADNGLTYSVNFSGFYAVSFTTSGINASTAESLVSAAAYENVSADVKADARVITLTSIQDAGGTANGGSDTVFVNASSTVTLVNVNDSPEVADVLRFSQEDGPVINGSFVATDADSIDNHTFTIVGAPSEGSVLNNNDGTFSFDPGVDFQDLAVGQSRDVSFSYFATDDSGESNADSSLATVTIRVSGTNDQPIASNLAIAANEDGASVTDSFIGSDVDSGDNLVYSITTAPAEGSVINNNDGTFTFDPGADFQDLAEGATRVVSFQYTVSDDAGSVSAVATVTVTVTGKNEAPVAGSLSLNASEDGAFVVGNFSVVDSDAGDTHTFIIDSAPAEGSVINNNDGSFQFDPGADFQDLAEGETRTVSFDYRVVDSSSAVNDTSLAATVSIVVQGTNDQPVVSDVAVLAAEDGASSSGSFLVSDADTTDVTSVTLLAAPSEGSLVNNGNGSFTFDPGSDFQDLALGESRTVSVGYQASDDSGAANDVSGVASLMITVTGTNDRPLVSDVALNAQEDGAAQLASFVVSDVDTSDTHSFVLLGQPTEGRVTNNLDGSFLFDVGGDFQDLAVGETRQVSFDYRALDSSGSVNGESSIAQVTVTVEGRNDRPQVTDVSLSVSSNEDSVISDFEYRDVDASDQHLVVVTDLPSAGEFKNLGNGQFQFIPGDEFDDLGFGQSVEVTARFYVQDDSGELNARSEMGVIAIEVTGDAPIIIDPIVPAPETPSPDLPDTPIATEPPSEGDGDSGEDPGESESDPDEGERNAAPGNVVDGDNDVGAVRGGTVDAIFELNLDTVGLEVNATAVEMVQVGFLNRDSTLASSLTAQSVDGLRASFSLYSDVLVLSESGGAIRGVEELNQSVEQQASNRTTAVSGMFAVSAGLSAGYVVWMVRSGILLSSVLSSLPAWRFIDPLPILTSAPVDADTDSESLQDIAQSNESLDKNNSPDETSQQHAEGENR